MQPTEYHQSYSDRKRPCKSIVLFETYLTSISRVMSHVLISVR